MGHGQEKLIKTIQGIQTHFLNAGYDYWEKYSSYDTWQFWLTIAFLLLPLIALYFLIDRKRALLLGFFGFNVHVWFSYIDTYGGIKNYWFYPYKVFPFFVTSFALDVSLVPVLYMFVYQWTLNHKKNYYLFITLLSAFLAFIIKPLLSMLNLIQLYNGANYFHLFIGYLLVAFVSKLITNLFVYFEKKGVYKTQNLND